MDDFSAPPQPANQRMKPITVEATEDGILVSVPAPGIPGEPKVLGALAGGFAFIALAFATNAAVWLGCLRGKDVGLLGIVAIVLVGAISGLLCTWGWRGFRGGLVAMMGCTRLTLRPGYLLVKRSGIPRLTREIHAADFKDLWIAEQLHMILELSVFLRKSKIITIISGRSREELCWLQGLIWDNFKKRQQKDPQAKEDMQGGSL